MKVIFLDFDGVLNSLQHYERISGKRMCEADLLDSECIRRLNAIVGHTRASVVVSSSWRIGHTLAELRRILRQKGFTGRVVGKTPEINTAGRERGHEIAAWLSCRDRIESFVILDDDSDMAHLKHRHIKTSFTEGGLSDAHVARAISMLEGPSP